MVRVCFVCLGNICRSPTAEAVMKHLVEREGLSNAIHVESAGTGDWHVGRPPDERSRHVAKGRGFLLEGRARQFVAPDFERFDYVVAMDGENRAELGRIAKRASRDTEVHMLRDFDPEAPRGSDVPDPYYGGPQGFERVIDICEAGCRGLLQHIREKHGL